MNIHVSKFLFVETFFSNFSICREKSSIISWNDKPFSYIIRESNYFLYIVWHRANPSHHHSSSNPTWPTCQSSSSIFSSPTFPRFEKAERFPRFARIVRLGISFLPLDLFPPRSRVHHWQYTNTTICLCKFSAFPAKRFTVLVSLWSRINEIPLSIRFPTSFGYRPVYICAWKS